MNYKARVAGNIDDFRIISRTNDSLGSDRIRTLWDAAASGTNIREPNRVLRANSIKLTFHRNGEVSITAPSTYWTETNLT